MQNSSGGPQGHLNLGGHNPMNDNIEVIFLLDQTQPQPLQTVPTRPIPVGHQLGQARFVLEPNVDSDGAASLSHGVNRINAAQNNVLQSGPAPVEASPSLHSPPVVVPSNRSELLIQPGNGQLRHAQGGTGSLQETPSLLGVDVRPRSLDVNNLFHRDQSSIPNQSASGFSADNMNVAYEHQLIPLPSENLNLHQQYEPQAQQTGCVVADDHVEAVDFLMQHAAITTFIGPETLVENWNKCYILNKRADLDEETARAFADQLLYVTKTRNGTTVKCLCCHQSGDVIGTFIHKPDCPVLVSLQRVKNNRNVSRTSGVTQTGACGGNTGLSNPSAQTACKKPEGQASVPPPQYPHQVSEATALRWYPPNDENQYLNPAALTRDTERPGEEYVRAESPEMFVASQNRPRAEARIPERYGTNIITQRSSSSLEHLSNFDTARGSSVSQTFRTARGSSVSQGGGDRNNSSLQNFVSAAQRRVCNPQYENLQARFSSFLYFPKDVSQSPQSLAEAGMFYTGYKDTCRCFYCGGDLHSWEPDDDPWQEHAQHYPDCGFVRQEKGQDYIDAVKLAFEEKSKVKSNSSSKVDTLDKEVQMCEEMGYEKGQVQQAVEKYRRGVEAGRISRQSDKLNGILNILEEMSRTENTGQSQAAGRSASLNPRPNCLDASYCSACKRQKATVAQQKCGHIVCKECAPKPDDKEPQCKYCRKEVVECIPVDTSFY